MFKCYKMCFYINPVWTLFIKESWQKKMYHGFHKKILSSTTVFNIDNNNKCFMRGNIRMISEGSCDKVWNNYAENSALRQTKKKKTVILNCHISQHSCISFLNKLPFKSITKQKSYWPQTPCLYYNNWVLTLNLILSLVLGRVEFKQ